jgi:hypothetical protein
MQQFRITLSLLCVMTLAIAGITLAHATDDPFIGRWSINPTGCKIAGSTADTNPLVVTDTSVAWFGSYCMIKKSYRLGEGLYLQAQCANEGKSRVMPIGLQLKGKKLHVTWDQTVAGDMQRCR